MEDGGYGKVYFSQVKDTLDTILENHLASLETQEMVFSYVQALETERFLSALFRDPHVQDLEAQLFSRLETEAFADIRITERRERRGTLKPSRPSIIHEFSSLSLDYRGFNLDHDDEFLGSPRTGGEEMRPVVFGRVSLNIDSQSVSQSKGMGHQGVSQEHRAAKDGERERGVLHVGASEQSRGETSFSQLQISDTSLHFHDTDNTTMLSQDIGQHRGMPRIEHGDDGDDESHASSPIIWKIKASTAPQHQARFTTPTAAEERDAHAYGAVEDNSEFFYNDSVHLAEDEEHEGIPEVSAIAPPPPGTQHGQREVRMSENFVVEDGDVTTASVWSPLHSRLSFRTPSRPLPPRPQPKPSPSMPGQYSIGGYNQEQSEMKNVDDSLESIPEESGSVFFDVHEMPHMPAKPHGERWLDRVRSDAQAKLKGIKTRTRTRSKRQ